MQLLGDSLPHIEQDSTKCSAPLWHQLALSSSVPTQSQLVRVFTWIPILVAWVEDTKAVILDPVLSLENAFHRCVLWHSINGRDCRAQWEVVAVPRFEKSFSIPKVPRVKASSLWISSRQCPPILWPNKWRHEYAVCCFSSPWLWPPSAIAISHSHLI